MKVYIASKYIEHESINNKIFEKLKGSNIETFLPKTINIDALTKEDMFTVSEKCFNEIETCDVIVIVTPFGISVSSEIGYAIALKRKCQNIKLLLLNIGNCQHPKLYKEAMIIPYIDKEFYSIDSLVDYINNL